MGEIWLDFRFEAGAIASGSSTEAWLVAWGNLFDSGSVVLERSAEMGLVPWDSVAAAAVAETVPQGTQAEVEPGVSVYKLGLVPSPAVSQVSLFFVQNHSFPPSPRQIYQSSCRLQLAGFQSSSSWISRCCLGKTGAEVCADPWP